MLARTVHPLRIALGHAVERYDTTTGDEPLVAGDELHPPKRVPPSGPLSRSRAVPTSKWSQVSNSCSSGATKRRLPSARATSSDGVVGGVSFSSRTLLASEGTDETSPASTQ